MSNVNASVKSAPITAPKFFRFNLFNGTIEGSEFNFKKAGNPDSVQYAELMKFKAIQPTFKYAPIASTKKVEKKQTYAGLTSDLIAEYVEVFGTDAQKAELTEMVDGNEAYPTIKSWFLDYFKAGFTVEKAKREIANKKLRAKKSKVRKVVKAKRVEAAPAAEGPQVVNF